MAHKRPMEVEHLYHVIKDPHTSLEEKREAAKLMVESAMKDRNVLAYYATINLFGEHPSLFHKHLATYAFEHNNPLAYSTLYKIAKEYHMKSEKYIDIFKEFFLSHIAEHSESIVKHAFQQNRIEASLLLSLVADRYPSFFRKHLLPHAIREAVQKKNERAYRFMSTLSYTDPELFHRYFSDHIVKHADIIVKHAFEHNNTAAYYFLSHIIPNLYPKQFRKYFSKPISEYSERILQHAVHQGNERAYYLLTILAGKHPSFFIKHFKDRIARHSEKISKHVFEDNNVAAYQFLNTLSEVVPDFVEKHFSHHIDHYVKKGSERAKSLQKRIKNKRLTRFKRIVRILADTILYRPPPFHHP